MMRAGLTLPEALLLLALHDDTGRVTFSGMLSHALAGALVAELVLAGHIEVERVRRSELINAVGTGTPADALQVEALERIRSARRRASAETWVGRLSGLRGLRERVAQSLCRRGVVKEEEERVLLLFSRRIYPTLDPEPEAELTERIRSAVLGDVTPVDARTAALIALANSVGLLDAVFSKAELKENRQRVDEIVAGQRSAEATKRAIEAVHAALIAASTVVIITNTGR